VILSSAKIRTAQALKSRFICVLQVSLETTANIIQEQKEKTRVVVEQQVPIGCRAFFADLEK